MEIPVSQIDCICSKTSVTPSKSRSLAGKVDNDLQEGKCQLWGLLPMWRVHYTFVLILNCPVNERMMMMIMTFTLDWVHLKQIYIILTFNHTDRNHLTHFTVKETVSEQLRNLAEGTEPESFKAGIQSKESAYCP